MVWNRQDWVGLILFGTEKCDEDSEIKHILTLQKLNPVSVDNLKEMIKIGNLLALFLLLEILKSKSNFKIICFTKIRNLY